MFDTVPADSAAPVPADDGPDPVPLERLEAEICELAGHLDAEPPPCVRDYLKRTSGTDRTRPARQPAGTGGAPLGC
jgi:hypothetical protein